MNYTSCPPVVMASQYSQELSNNDYILKIVSCTIMLLLTIPVISLNMLIIFTVIKTPSLQNPSFILICSLALTDFSSGLAALPINASWRIIEFVDRDANVCSTFDVGFAIAFTLLSSSELTVTALSIDRYLAVHLSQRYRQLVTNRRAVIVVVVLWCTAVIWGISSVFITPKVLHTTVVVAGILTFGSIFLCYVLAFKTLLGQEAKSRERNVQASNFTAGQSTLTSEIQATQELLTTSPRRQQTTRNSSLQKNMTISSSKKNEEPVRNQDEVSISFVSLKSEIMHDNRRMPDVVEPELEESRIERFRDFRHHCERRVVDDKDLTLSGMNASNSSKDSKLTDKTPLQESNCAESMNSFKDFVDNNVVMKIENQKSRQKRFSYLRKKLRTFRSGAGTSVRLVKYRYTIVTLLWVITMFILCYAPYFFLSFVVAFTGMTNEGAVAWSIAIAAICINSLINPVIYLWRLRMLRRACVNILKRNCC